MPPPPDKAQDLRRLEDEFWSWRATTQPDGYDDLPRIERPPGWTPDWSPAAVADRRTQLDLFRQRVPDLGDLPVPVQVDGCLLGSAIERVGWELEALRNWQTNPQFYVEQALGPIFVLLLEPPPVTERHGADLLALLAAVPRVLESGQENLTGHAARPFVVAALASLDHAPADLTRSMARLDPTLGTLAERAAAALAEFRAWLQDLQPGDRTPVGAAALQSFCSRVALLPYTVDEIRAMARQEWHRTVALNLHRSRPAPQLPASAAAQVEQQRLDEQTVRDFYRSEGILDLPESLRRYRFAPMPDYLAPLGWLGVRHHLGTPTTPAVRYVPEPTTELAYFDRAAADDPRLTIVHEGVHAHQLALSWQHSDPARRRYYDSAANEGIAFYHEVLMLEHGLFDDRPASAYTITDFIRLRALRVEVDIALATGELDLDEAAALLAGKGGLDAGTAGQEATFFAMNPGQAMSYTVGKLQVLDLLTEAASRDGFRLDEFHGRLWREGNVPLSLQRWELLGLRDHIALTGALR